MRHLTSAFTLKKLFLLVTLLLTSLSIAVAEPMPESEIPVRFTSWHIAYDVNADGSYVETQTMVGERS